MRSYVWAVAWQVSAILLVVAVVLGGTAWLSRSLWDVTVPHYINPPGSWRPYVFPDRDLWCWRPEGWPVREETGKEGTRVVVEAGPTAQVTVLVRPLSSAPFTFASSVGQRSSTRVAADALNALLTAMARRSGFWHTPVSTLETRLGKTQATFFAYWSLMGIRPVPSYGWVCAGVSGDKLVLAAATCDRDGLEQFSAPAVQMIKTLRAWSGKSSAEEPQPNAPHGVKAATARSNTREASQERPRETTLSQDQRTTAQPTAWSGAAQEGPSRALGTHSEPPTIVETAGQIAPVEQAEALRPTAALSGTEGKGAGSDPERGIVAPGPRPSPNRHDTPPAVVPSPEPSVEQQSPSTDEQPQPKAPGAEDGLPAENPE